MVLAFCAVAADERPATELGSPEARVVVEEFSDYRCPYCRMYATKSFPAISARYVTTGRVRYLARDYPLQRAGTGSSRIAEAARCAGEQGRFWEMRRELFAGRHSDSVGELTRLGNAVGVEGREFEACLADGTYAHAVREDVARAERLGVKATPTFVVVRTDRSGQVTHQRVVVGAGERQLRRAIDELIAAGS